MHRASPKRAGALTMMVGRLCALEHPKRFEQLLSVCTCDFAAYEGHSAQDYPKASILRRVARACASVDATEFDEDELIEAQTEAVVEELESLTRLGCG